MGSIKGVIAVIGNTQQVTDTFKKREFVIVSQSGQYENNAAFQFTQDRCALGDALAEGQEVEVFYNIRSKEHNGRWFTNLDAWKVEVLASTQTAPAPVAQAPTMQVPVMTTQPTAEEEEDGLPF